MPILSSDIPVPVCHYKLFVCCNRFYLYALDTNTMDNENHTSQTNPDVILIGAGIMSATLGVFLKQLQPDLTIEIFERLDKVAMESSNAWNNAGTGHSALCELNYTPEQHD